MKHTYWFTIVFVLFFALYAFKGATMLDPDFGWHIRAGQYILAHGFAYADPFSYTMPSYLFVDHEWLTNLIWTIMLPITGYLSFALVYAFFTITAIFLQTTLVSKKWLLLPLILVGGSFIDFIGVRTQVIDWLFISLLIFLFLKKILLKKWHFLPLLFLLWANIHGGFGIGLGVLAILLGVKSIEEKKDLWKNALLFVICVLITLVNPFGIRLWGEFLNQLSDTQLRWTVQEWFPAFYFYNLAFWIYAALSVSLVICYRKCFSLTILVLYCLFFIAGMTSIRNIPIFVIVSLYPTVKGIEYLFVEASKHPYGKERFRKGYIAFITIALVFFLPQLGLYIYSMSLSPDKFSAYPVGAVAYLQKHLPKGNIMTTYGWGGYLLWQLPQKKDFIDGRMPSWRNSNAPENESTYALEEYKNLLQQKELFATAVNKYSIDTLVVTVNDLQDTPYRFLGIDPGTNPVLEFLFGSKLNFAKVVSQARLLGWKEVYHDRTAVVFEK